MTYEEFAALIEEEHDSIIKELEVEERNSYGSNLSYDVYMWEDGHISTLIQAGHGGYYADRKAHLIWKFCHAYEDIVWDWWLTQQYAEAEDVLERENEVNDDHIIERKEIQDKALKIANYNSYDEAFADALDEAVKYSEYEDIYERFYESYAEYPFPDDELHD